jgi:hypothetical protein
MSVRAAVPLISRVAFLLSIQGAGQIITVFIELLSLPAYFFYAARATHRVPSNLEVAALLAWLVLVGAGGLLSLRAARQNREYRGRRVALAAFGLGPVSCLLGVPVLVYGLWCYRRVDVKDVFAQGEAGVSPWDIEHGD